MIRIAFVPIDNRPICYSFSADIASISTELELILPSRSMLGGLNTTANTDGLFAWLENLKNVDLLILSLDTITYGGLVSSRRCNETFEEIKKRVEKIAEVIKKNNIKTYAFSSVMRISNNNVNEEEKLYWNEYGTKLFEYSYKFHEALKNNTQPDLPNIPKEILSDYLNTRKRNFEINKLYLDLQKDGLFEYLIFSKDDSGKYGLNVKEAEELNEKIASLKLNALVKTGADEIPFTLLSRAFCEFKNIQPKIYTEYLRPSEIELYSRYEDVSIKASIETQIIASGAKIANSKDECDIILVVNNFEKEQGEHVFNIPTKNYEETLEPITKPTFYVDIAYANGADVDFANKVLLFANERNFLGYSAWNTTSNTVGSAITLALVKNFSTVNDNNFKRSQFIRFMDDYAYQAICRKVIKNKGFSTDLEILKEEMLPYAEKISGKINYKPNSLDFTYPWNRSFEVEIITD